MTGIRFSRTSSAGTPMIKVRILATVARFAHAHPRVVLALLAGGVITLAEIAFIGAVALVTYPSAWKWGLFAVAIATFVWLRTMVDKHP